MGLKQHYTHNDLAEIRATPGRTALLFITDRCPVECVHCSVGSQTHSPGIADFEFFYHLVQELAHQPKLEVVGISGGEPFVERQGLHHACKHLHQAGLGLVIFSSGLWGRSQSTPEWISEVLDCTNTMVLSTDAFHQNKVSPEHFCNAVRAVVKHKVWLVVQTLNPDQTHQLLQETLGPLYLNHAEIVPLRPLNNGRGQTVFIQSQKHKPQNLSPCPLVANPVLRYDGTITACCNEDVITGHGPKALHKTIAKPRLNPQQNNNPQVDGETQLNEAIVHFQRQPLLHLMRTIGPAGLIEHDKFSHLKNNRYHDTCEFCWAAHQLAFNPNRPPYVQTTNIKPCPCTS